MFCVISFHDVWCCIPSVVFHFVCKLFLCLLSDNKKIHVLLFCVDLLPATLFEYYFCLFSVVVIKGVPLTGMNSGVNILHQIAFHNTYCIS